MLMIDFLSQYRHMKFLHLILRSFEILLIHYSSYFSYSIIRNSVFALDVTTAFYFLLLRVKVAPNEGIVSYDGSSVYDWLLHNPYLSRLLGAFYYSS